MKRKSVESSNIKSIGYNESKRFLEIEFSRGDIYQYLDVPVKEYINLINAESIGKYFWTHIRNIYGYKRIGG